MVSVHLLLCLLLPLFRVALCRGKFPNFLMDAWDEYDFRKDSDNDRPGKKEDEERLRGREEGVGRKG